jgi:DNA-binding LacI/PurR family transcriptional regulator
MKHRDKKPRMVDVAKQAGVSISSVSRVTQNYPGIHPKLRSRVERAMQELGYFRPVSKRNLREPSDYLIYFLLANRALHIPFHSRILQSIENECSRNGDRVLFRTLRYLPETPPEHLNVRQLLELSVFSRKGILPDGVILTGLTYPNLLAAFREANIPVILLGNNFSGSTISGDAVTFDAFNGAYDATHHLIDLGHTNILFIGDPKLSWFSALYRGYLQALEETGLKPIAQTKGLSDNFYSNGYLSVNMAFEQSSEITAIFAGYDDCAMGAMKALNDRGLSVPRDVSVIGFDDEDYAAFTVPPLTTVRIDVEAIGRELINQLYKKLKDPSVVLPVIHPRTVLMKRGTCWPAKVLSQPPMVPLQST